MAIPSTTYDIATISNPTSALTDFTLIVDLSNMSTAWWAAVNTTDGTKGRASKSDGITELACDFIDFNSTLETGILRVKYTGTLASTGTQQIRVYPPNTANSSYLATDTYGQYNAYSSNWLGYWPLMSDSNDRTVAQNNGISQGGLTIGGVAGKIGAASSFDGIDDWIELSPVFSSGATDFEIDLFHKGTDINNLYFGQGSTLGLSPRVLFFHQTDYKFISSGFTTITTNDDIDGTWRNIGASNSDIYIDSVSRGSFAQTINSGTYDNAGIGAFNRGGSLYQPTLGEIQEVKAFDSSRPDPERTHEYSQTSDNATFWGTWTNVPVSGTTYTIDLDTGVFALTGDALELLKNSAISLESGSFALTGQDITLLKNSVINLETGIFSLTGYSMALIYDDGSISRGSSPLGYKRKSYSDEQKKLYYINQILWRT